MNYEEHFGSDWQELDLESALIRAFALGIAHSEENAPDGELDRLHAVANSRYEAHLITTAFQEGQQFAGAGPGGVVGRLDELPDFLRALDMDLEVFLGDQPDSFERNSIPVFLTETPMHGIRLPSPLTLELPRMLFRNNRPP